MAGLTTTGFTVKTLDEIQDEIKAELLARISSQLNLESDSNVGILVAVVSEAAALLWEELANLYAAGDPDNATGTSLDSVAALTGTTRAAATKARAGLLVNVDPGTYAAGTLVVNPVGDTGTTLSNLEAIVNGGGGAADVAGVWEATEAGLTGWSTSTVFEINGAVTGWNSVANSGNPTTVTNGTDTETDAELRTRRGLELAASGSTNVDAINADIVRDGDGVISVVVLENDTEVTSADGIPPKSVEAIVYGPVPPSAADDEQIAEIIFGSKAAGIRAFGTTEVVVDDSQGYPHTIGFTRPVAVPMESSWTLTLDGSGDYPGDAAAKDIIAAWGNALGPGVSVRYIPHSCVGLDIPGVLDVSMTFAKTGGSLGTSTVVISLREVATFDTADIVIATV